MAYDASSRWTWYSPDDEYAKREEQREEEREKEEEQATTDALGALVGTGDFPVKRVQAAAAASPKSPPDPMAVDITGLDKVAVLHALWSASRATAFKAEGFGPNYSGGGGVQLPPFNFKQAIAKAQEDYIDYFQGFAILMDLRGDTIDPQWYDHSNGAGAAARAIAKLRQPKPTA